MAKQLSITIPDKMYEQIQKLKGEMSGRKGKRKISKICQKALSVALLEAESSSLYRLEGIKDGEMMLSCFSEADKKYISRVLDKTGPYNKWSEFERIEEIKKHFEEIKQIDISSLYPKFIDIMKGKIVLHDWVNYNDDQISEDRMSEMAWSYVAGFYEGIKNKYIKSQKNV